MSEKFEQAAAEMSIHTPSTLSATIDFARVANEFFEAVSRAFSSFVPHLDKLHRIANRVVAAKDVPGHTEFIAKMSSSMMEAKIMSLLINYLGSREVEEQNQKRALSSIMRKIIKARTERTLKKAVNEMVELLDAHSGFHNLHEACYALGLSPSAVENSIREAAEGMPALKDVRETISALVQHMPDPRGAKPSLISLTHDMLLVVCEASGRTQKYTYSDSAEDHTDAATRATRAAFDSPTFDPRPICRARSKRAVTVVSKII